MEMPERIARLNQKPGDNWTPAECTAFKKWLSARPQLRNIWYYAALYLGNGASNEDIEDAVVELYTMIDRVRVNFKPEGMVFVHYLLHVCFKNYCLREGSRLRRRSNTEIVLAYDVDDETVIVDIADTDLQSDPNRLADSIAFTEELSFFLRTCKFPPNQRQAFVLHVLQGITYEAVAEHMGVPIGSVKVWLSRGKAAARQFLQERGWSECQSRK
jgi:RNA polymerase sigma factor (sigma-70 family)